MRRITVLDAPTNLGLRPPTATSVPGCAKAPGALRDQGLLTRLRARDAGCLTPPRYDPGEWQPGDGVAQASQIARYSTRLANRIGAILAAGEFPVILGGDCSVVLGSGLAMRRHGTDLDGHIGLVYVDGHSDFRHPGNASYVGAAAGECLALVTGRGQPDLAAIERRRPYFRDVDVVLLGIRPRDEYRLDLQAAGIAARAVPQLRSEGAARTAQWARRQLADCHGYWVHIDVDVLDPAVMPAVDAPDPGGIAYAELELLLNGLVATPQCLGLEITVFDPDYDSDGVYARELTETLVAGLSPLLAADPPPPSPVSPPVPPVPASAWAPVSPAVAPVPAAAVAPVAAAAVAPVAAPAVAPVRTVPAQPGPSDGPVPVTNSAEVLDALPTARTPSDPPVREAAVATAAPVGSAGVGPTAVGPTAVATAAPVGSAGVGPTAVGPTAVGPTAVGPTGVAPGAGASAPRPASPTAESA